MKAIVVGIGIPRDDQRQKGLRITLEFSESTHSRMGLGELSFWETDLGIVGLQLGDELTFLLLPKFIGTSEKEK